MPAIDEDDRPKKKIVHEIGQDLSLLSVGELNERIALMKSEIARLEVDINSKQSSRSTADQFFDESQFESYRALGQHIAERIPAPWNIN